MHFAQKSVRPQRRLKDWKLNSVVERLDVFGQPLPVFNLKGNSEVHTLAGGLLTLSIFIVFVIYGTIKMI